MYRYCFSSVKLLSGYILYVTLCSLCIIFLAIHRFGFEGRIWVLVALVSGHCLRDAFSFVWSEIPRQ